MTNTGTRVTNTGTVAADPTAGRHVNLGNGGFPSGPSKGGRDASLSQSIPLLRRILDGQAGGTKLSQELRRPLHYGKYDGGCFRKGALFQRCPGISEN